MPAITQPGILLGFLFLLMLCAIEAEAAPPAGYRLAWSDEFRQEPGSAPDPTRWNHELGGHGWGNNELQTYVNNRANSRIVSDALAGDGRALRIRAVKDADGKFTSARLTTAGKFTTKYGYVEARIRLPRGRGIWPAFWMLGEDIGKVGWPACGEIDVMEFIGHDDKTVYGSLHGPGYSGGNAIVKPHKLPGEASFLGKYHTFAALWTEDAITFSVDGVTYQKRTEADVPAGGRWAFDKPHFLLLNLAVGGHWPGKPDATTTFPQDLFVDYVRVYHKR